MLTAFERYEAKKDNFSANFVDLEDHILGHLLLVRSLCALQRKLIAW